MADEETKARAETRFTAALEAAGARDPREFFRGWMRELKGSDRRAYDEASRYYEERLIPAVADAGSDPHDEWLDFGRYLAALKVPGRAVRVDTGGRAREHGRRVSRDELGLHLPETTAQPALVLGLPPKLSPAQRATFALLVKQAQE